MDVAACIEYKVPGAQYYGSVGSNTREDYELIEWIDPRPQPTWEELVAVSHIPSEPVNARLQTKLRSIVADPIKYPFLEDAHKLTIQRFSQHIMIDNINWTNKDMARIAKQQLLAMTLPSVYDVELAEMIDMCEDVITDTYE